MFSLERIIQTSFGTHFCLCRLYKEIRYEKYKILSRNQTEGDSSSFPATLQQTSPSWRKTSSSTFLMSEPLQFLLEEFDITFTVKPEFKCLITYGLEIIAMHIAVCILVTEAGVNLINPHLIRSSWGKRIQTIKVPRLGTATGQTINLDGRILVHLPIGNLCTHVWFDAQLQP